MKNWMRILIPLTVVALFVGCSMQKLVLVKDGVPQATIILPDQPNATEQKAAEVLVKYIKLASGATLPIAKESKKTEGTVISLGQTRMAEAAGISAKDLKYDGYRLTVKNGMLYILGRDTPHVAGMPEYMGAQGCYRAALALLHQIGLRWLQPTDNGIYVPSLKAVAVPNTLDITYEPAFMYAACPIAPHGEDWFMANGIRCVMNIYSEGGHTWCTFVPASLWETHPEYFQMRNGKRVKPEGHGYYLCPSNPDVQKLLADGIRKKFDEGFDLVQLGQSDGYRPCECDVCKALDRPGEIQEQVQIPHCNVIKMVQQTHPDKLVHLLIYPPSNIPSRTILVYPPNVMGEVCLTWTTAQAFVGNENFDRTKLAQGHEAALKFWSEKMPAGLTVYVYFWGAYHATGLAPQFTPKMVSEQIRRFHKFNVKGIFFCGGMENWGAEGPSYYVAGQMMNDPQLEWSALVDEYCRCTFGKAAKTMRSYYDLLNTQIENAPFSPSSGGDAFKATYPLPVLDQLDGLLGKAKTEAVGDARALNWLRLVEISHRQFSLLARGYHYYQAYQDDLSPQNFEKIKQAVQGYRTLTDEILNMSKADPVFLYGYFCSGSWGHWKNALSTNGGMKRSKLGVPFTWDFEAFDKAQSLPGGVMNSSFENTDIEIQSPSDWYLYPPADVKGRCFIDQGTAHSGQKSLYFKFGPSKKGNSFIAYQHVPRKYKTGQKFTFSCWVKTSGLRGNARVGVMRYPIVPEDRAVIFSKQVLSGTNDWTLLSVTFPGRAGMNEAQVRCNANGTAGEAWFDDAKIEETRKDENK